MFKIFTLAIVAITATA
jgi:hypothetical protein